MQLLVLNYYALSDKVHPSAHRLADAIGQALTKLEPSSARLSHLKAGATCTQKPVSSVAGKDAASADKHQGRATSLKPVSVDQSDDEEEESYFQLNQWV
jgi:hypothetical protein